MRKEGMIILFVSIIFSLSFISSATYYVDPSGSDSNNGSEDFPWETIGEHLYDATYTNIGIDDTLFIKNGTYDEGVTFSTGVYTGIDGGKLVGESRDGVIIKFTSASAVSGFYLNNAGLSFYNLTIDGSNGNGNCLTARNVIQDLIISDVKFYDCNYGINIYDAASYATNVTIENSLFEELGYPIEFGDDSLNFWVNSTLYNNTFTNYTDIGVGLNDNSSSGLQLNSTNNIFINDIFIKKDNRLVFESNNNFITDTNRIYFIDYNPEETFEYNNLDIYFKNYSSSIALKGIYFENASNILLENITFCNNSKCHLTEYKNHYMISGTSNENITLNNISMDVNATNHTWAISMTGDNLTVKNSNISVDSKLRGSAIFLAGDNGLIDNNTVNIYNNTMSYGVGIGGETLPGTGRYTNGIISNNIVYANYDGASTILHTYFLGYTNNSMLLNNTQYGGGYAHVIKGNTNVIVNGSKIYGGTNYEGILEKGGSNNIFRNIYIEAKDNESSILDLRFNDADGFTVTNSTWQNIEIICEGVDCGFNIAASGDVFLKDVVGNYDYTPGANADVYEYSSITLGDSLSDLAFTITNNQSTSTNHNTDTYVSEYFLSGFYNSTDYYNYSGYSWVASKFGQSSSGSFFLTALYTLSLPTFTQITSQQSGVSEITYTISNEEIKEGYSRALRNGQKVKITINEEDKIIEIKSVDSNKDKVEFSIGEGTYEVGLENSTKIDTNDDGYYDLKVSVSDVGRNGYADLEFKEIYEEVPSEEGEGVVEDIKEFIEKKIKDKNNLLFYILGGALLLGIFIWFRFFRKE
jgi:hypothetical protein